MKTQKFTTPSDWQTHLKEQGHYLAKIDGLWGPISRQAIKDYCKAHGLMHIRVNRNKSDSQSTLAEVFINGKFTCHFLEDAYHAKKVKGCTRIPAGTYTLGVRKTGGFHNRYRKLFKEWHKGMLHVINVPNYKYILHHIGNSHRDTAGCSLVGIANYDSMWLSTSRIMYKQYYLQVINQALDNQVLITYEDNDR